MRVVIFSALIVIADQAAKLAVKGFDFPLLGIRAEGVPYGASFPVLGDFLRLTYIENPGMAFGIDVGGKLFFSLFSVLASAGILWYLYRAKDEPLAFRLSLALILGGAVGNLIDRVFYGVIFGEAALFYGRVVDFIDVDFFNVSVFGYTLHRWPVFNIADASVTCGVLLMLVSHRRTAAAAAAAAGGAAQAATPAVADPPPGGEGPGG
jgi:signal peptidase II